LSGLVKAVRRFFWLSINALSGYSIGAPRIDNRAIFVTVGQRKRRALLVGKIGRIERENAAMAIEARKRSDAAIIQEDVEGTLLQFTRPATADEYRGELPLPSNLVLLRWRYIYFIRLLAKIQH
jgi:hypothetical protein